MRTDFLLREARDIWWVPGVTNGGWCLATAALLFAVVNRSLLWLLVMVACDLAASCVATWSRSDCAGEVLTIGEGAVVYRRGRNVVSVPTCDIAMVDCVFGSSAEGATDCFGVPSVGLWLTGNDGRPLLVAPVHAPAESLLSMIRTLRKAAPHVSVGQGVLKLMVAELHQS